MAEDWLKRAAEGAEKDEIIDNLKRELEETKKRLDASGNTLLIDLDKLTFQEKEYLKKVVNRIRGPKKKFKVWKPQDYHTYCFVNSCGNIMIDEWTGNDTDLGRYSIGNTFKSKSDARPTVNYLRTVFAINKYISENDPIKLDWNDSLQSKYTLTYDHQSHKFRTFSTFDCEYACGIFFSENFNWKLMIKTIGEDRIKRDLFGVED